VKVARAYISLCQLVYNPEWDGDNRYEQHQLTLVQILTTLCTTARNDFLLYDGKLDRIIRWTNGMELMKNCYCNRKIPVDRAALLEMRDAYFVQNRFFYDPSRCIARNHQLTGDYDAKYQKENHLEESAKWKLRLGIADYSKASNALSPPIVSVEQVEKKQRSVKAKKIRLENLAVLNGSADAVVTKKPPKLKQATASSSVLVEVNSSAISSPAAVVMQKNLPHHAVIRKDTSTPLPKSNLIDVRAVIQEADVVEERIKQESRLKLVAMQEEVKLQIESAKEQARLQENAFKLEEQRIRGQQQLVKEQTLLDTQKEGIIFCIYFV
jgi:hypothetical protein